MNTAISIGVAVERGGPKKGKKQRNNMAQMEQAKSANYELLRRLGFDRDFIDESARLGLKERQEEKRKNVHQYLLEAQS